MLTAHQIREKFLAFFEARGHERIRSSSLVPTGDPTLFFTNAGMVQFKDIFTGQEKPTALRATTSQKCMRVSGKHNDLENVGRTHRHHTFFEMLGNFSFGDYFKKEAIGFAWEFLTKEIGLDPDRLWISVFREDDEAEELWQQTAGVSPHRIIRLDEKDNFWSMGEEGPCGPCSEIYFDHGIHAGCQKPSCKIGCDCDRFMEIWNLVFMQFNRTGGQMTPLPKPSVDTGMGLERLSCVVQGVHSNYDSDLFTPLLQKIGEKVGKTYGPDEATNISMRVLADHIRAATFLIGDGVQPSNEGRGYVLRRILRRAIRHGWLLGMRTPFFFELSATVIEPMRGAYPELTKHASFIRSVIQAEEGRFLETLEKGLEMIRVEIESQKSKGQRCFEGDVVFKLYDTFGFPVDLTQTIADEIGFTVDLEGFESAMSGQRETARRAWKGSGEERVAQVYQELVQHTAPITFLGYETLQADSTVVALIRNGEVVSEVKTGETVQLITAATPFYGESGGQVGDRGLIQNEHFLLEVTDTQKPNPQLIVHGGVVKKGSVRVSAPVSLLVKSTHRNPVRRNHTATHLLHAALRTLLGEHVRQAGSLVEAERLRFDFSHFEPVSEEQLEEIENLVNEKIRANLPVEKREMSYDEAIGFGAMALFGEKYGDQVRVLKAGDFSIELCGGTHVDHTGEIGLFKVIQESSVAAGIRRIVAITGKEAVAYCHHLERELFGLAQLLKVGVESIRERVAKLLDQSKKQEREITQLKQKLLSGSSAPDLDRDIRQKEGICFLAVKSEAEDVAALRAFSDQIIHKLKTGVALVAAQAQGKCHLIVRVSKDLTPRYNAGDLIKPLAQMIDGSGGGKAEMAQAGGAKLDQLDQVF